MEFSGEHACAAGGRLVGWLVGSMERNRLCNAAYVRAAAPLENHCCRSLVRLLSDEVATAVSDVISALQSGGQAPVGARVCVCLCASRLWHADVADAI